MSSIEHELQVLEAAIAHPASPFTSPFASGEEHATCVELVASQLQTFTGQLKDVANVDPSHLAQAGDHIERLVRGLRGTLQYVAASTAQASAARI